MRGCLRGMLSLIEEWGPCPLPFKVDKQLVVSEGVVLQSSFVVDFFVLDEVLDNDPLCIIPPGLARDANISDWVL